MEVEMDEVIGVRIAHGTANVQHGTPIGGNFAGFAEC
jgi:hypothetical protein